MPRIPLSLRRLYAPECLVREGLKAGGIPGAREAYGTAVGVAWAAVAETFLIALISMADTLMVSVVGDEAIAAVGLVTQPRFIAQMLVMALCFSVTSITARRKGERDTVGASDCLKQALLVCVALSAVSALAFMPFTEPMLRFAGAQDDAIVMSKEYFDIILIGMPLCNVSMAISAALRGVGDTKASMAINMASNVVNLVLNYLLIGGNFGFPRLEVRGAAIATAIGWGVGMALALFFVTRRDGFVTITSRHGWKPERKMLASMYKVGSGSFVEQLCMRAGFLTYSMAIAGLGTITFATHQIMINILSLSFSFGEGYGITASSLVGQNLGRRRPDLSIVYGHICQRMSVVTSTAVLALLLTRGRALLALFSDNPLVMESGSRVLLLMAIIIYGQSSQMIYLGSLRGAGDTRYTAAVSLVSIAIVRPALAWALAYPLGFGLVGAWVGFLVDQYTRLVLSFRRFASGKWMAIKL